MVCCVASAGMCRLASPHILCSFHLVFLFVTSGSAFSSPFCRLFSLVL